MIDLQPRTEYYKNCFLAEANNEADVVTDADEEICDEPFSVLGTLLDLANSGESTKLWEHGTDATVVEDTNHVVMMGGVSYLDPKTETQGDSELQSNGGKVKPGFTENCTGDNKWLKTFEYFWFQFLAFIIMVGNNIWSAAWNQSQAILSSAGSLVSGSRSLVIQASIAGKNLKLLVDTGSQASIISSETFSRWDSPPELERSYVNLITVGSDRVPVTGCASLDIQYLDGVWKVPWLIAPISSRFEVDGILGMDAMTKMNATIIVSKENLQFIVRVEENSS